MAKKTSLLDKAKAQRVNARAESMTPSNEEMDLFIAYFNGEIRLTQAAIVLGQPKNRLTGLYQRAVHALRHGIKTGKASLTVRKG